MAPEMVTRADTARLFFRCSDPGDPVYSHMTLADAEHTAQLLRERQIQTDLGFADTAEFQALEAAAVRRPGEPPLHAVADQIHAYARRHGHRYGLRRRRRHRHEDTHRRVGVTTIAVS